ncbi:hypothetical protein [Niabella drilacis]|nr:hypothetical protein [Niabella drilacis]
MIGSGWMIKPVAGSNIKFFGIPSRSSTPAVTPISLDGANGTFLQGKKALEPELDFNSYIFEVFPDGKQMITTSGGYIFDDAVSYNGKPAGDGYAFTCFTFDKENNQILGGTANKTIEVFTVSGKSHVKTYYPKLVPVRIFIIHSKLVVIGTTSPQQFDRWGGPKTVAIEFIDL